MNVFFKTSLHSHSKWFPFVLWIIQENNKQQSYLHKINILCLESLWLGIIQNLVLWCVSILGVVFAAAQCVSVTGVSGCKDLAGVEFDRYPVWADIPIQIPDIGICMKKIGMNRYRYLYEANSKTQDLVSVLVWGIWGILVSLYRYDTDFLR